MAGIEEAFEKFSDRLAREESKRYSKDEQGDYREYLSEEQDQYPIKLGPLQLGANANMSTGKFSPNEYQNVSTMNRNVGLRGRYDVPDSGIALLGSIGDVRSNQNVRTNLPFNPMTGEASPYSEIRKDVYKDSPYSVGAQYNPQGTDEMYSALYNKGGGYNLGYNKGPVNVSYTSNPGLGNNVMLRGQYNFADGGVASMFRERPGYQMGGATPQLNPFASSNINPLDEQIRQYTNGRFQNMQEYDQFKNQLLSSSNSWRDSIDPVSGQTFGLYISQLEDNVGSSMTQQQQQRQPVQYQYSDKGTMLEQFGYQPQQLTPELQAQIDQYKNALNRVESSYGKKFSEISGPEQMTNPGAYGQTGGMPFSANEYLSRSYQSEKDAAARVVPKMAYGGRVSMSDGGLTTTIAPAKGPDSQGVESLFRRRYN